EEALDISMQYDYKFGIIEHWIKTLGLSKTKEYLETLRKPYNSVWLQVNTSKIDYDSLFTIFDEMEFKVSKHPYFDDFLEIKVEEREAIKDEQLPQVTIDREAVPNVALGKDVITATITDFTEFNSGERVKIVDLSGNLIATGIAEVESKEIPALSQRVVVKVTNSLAYIPPLTELRVYRRGYFNILTPIQALGIKSMYLSKKDNVLVMSGDKGDVSCYIAELTNHKVPITVIAINEMQLKALNKQIKRIQTKAIRVLHIPYSSFLKEVHKVKFSSVYVEPPNSRSAVLPSFSSILTIKRLKAYVRYQKQLVNHLYRCLYENASISYVTHSLDVEENEYVFKNVLEKAYYTAQSFPIEIRKLQNRGIFESRKNIDIIKELYSEDYHQSTIFLDPIKTNNSGGFLAKFKLKKSKTSSQ
ncbi:MAG: PUA domain-containing protein, partial [Candidatus Heimdallarchaeaceae archaeon]